MNEGDGRVDWARLRAFGVVTIAVAVLAVTACAPSQPAAERTSSSDGASTARLADPAEFAALIDEPGWVTVNVHVPFEGDLPGTDLSIPYDQITAQADRLPADRSTGLAIYCRSGSMSTTAGKALRGLGYTNVVELNGGMKAWTADDRQLIGV